MERKTVDLVTRLAETSSSAMSQVKSDAFSLTAAGVFRLHQVRAHRPRAVHAQDNVDHRRVGGIHGGLGVVVTVVPRFRDLTKLKKRAPVRKRVLVPGVRSLSNPLLRNHIAYFQILAPDFYARPGESRGWQSA